MAGDYRDLAAHYALLFPLNERQQEFFGHLLATGPVGSVLDVGCGTGEHLAWFSSRGLHAYGLEPDEAMFRELLRRDWPGTVPTLVQAGVEALPGAVGERVELVLCLGNTLPHVPDRTSARKALLLMAAALSPRGRLVIQTVNFDRILEAGGFSFPVIERALPRGGRIVFHREYDLTTLPEHILFKTRLESPAGERCATWPLVPLHREELLHDLGEAGLQHTLEFGDYNRQPYERNSPALILLAHRADPQST